MSGGKRILPDEAWAPEPSSLVDPVGRVIHYEGRVLRGIRKEFAADIPTMLEVAERDRWFEHGLIPTWETEFATEEFPLVLEHQRVPFVTLRGEWPAAALKRAALCHLELSAVLAKSGYCLKDAHTWNLLFDGPVPRITDFGSIRPLAELDWTVWLSEFHKYFVAPLLVFSRGQAGLARAMLHEHLVGVGLWLIDHEPNLLLPPDRATMPAPPYDAERMFGYLHDSVSALTFPHPSTDWTRYEQPATAAPPADLRAKDRLVRSLLDRVEFASAIDFGANRGLHASMCAEKGAAVLACDIDESCLDDMFVRAGQRRDRVLPLYVDVVLPAGAGGAFNTIAPARDRLRCDLVLALALVHHICRRWRFPPAAFAKGVAAFTRHAAIVEFIPADDWHVAQWGAELPPGYSIDAMHEALVRLFHRVDRVMSEPAPRQIFVCEGKR